MARKRGNNEGSIYRMQDGRWRAAVMVGWKVLPDGTRIPTRKIFTAATRHEVAEQLTAALRDRDRGIPINVGKQTVGEFLTAWLDNTIQPSVRPKTYRSYEQMVRCHLVKDIPEAEWQKRKLDAVPGLKDVQLSKLTLQQVQQFFNEKLKAGNSPALVRYLRVVFRVALNEALKADLIARNTAALSTPPKVEKQEIVPFTAVQAGSFLKAALGHRLEALFTVGLAVGIRSGECSALRWPDVDLDAGSITVRHTLQRVKLPGEKKGRITSLPPLCRVPDYAASCPARRDLRAFEL